MRIAHRTKSNARKIFDANVRLTDPWTDLVIQEVNRLQPGVKADYLKSVFLSKFVSKDTDAPELRRSRAIEKWLATEERNLLTNSRVFELHEDYNILPRVTWSKFIRVCQSIVADVIGESVPEEALIGSFSGGASTSRLRTESHPASKYIGKADITAAARPWFELAFELMPGWNQFSDHLILNEVRGNVLFTVPKNTTIDRCACKEPDLNMFLQKGAGKVIRQSLRRKGINLNDQTVNQRLARRGSTDGSLATLDLSSASDSVSCSLVELLLPPLWFNYLNDIRSHRTIIDGQEHVNEMFSSMGNGFTFELESLLFYSIARSVAYLTNTQGTISVYGDDIICPSDMYHDLEWVLSVCGFSVNTDKSYSEGPFRESCGGHYHDGIDITPFYLRRPIERLTDLIQIANAIRKWSETSLDILSDDLEPLWLLIAESIPRSLWGGHDYGSITQLVSPCNPRKQLVSREKTRDTALGGYVHWLNSTDGRASLSESVSTSQETRAIPKYRTRPVRKTGVRPKVSVFLSEI